MTAVLRYDQVGVRSQHHAWRNCEIKSVTEFPPAQIHRVRPAIVKLDVLVAAVAGNRRVHDFVDDDVADANGAVRQAGRSRGQTIELLRAVRVTPGRYAILLPAELYR